MPFLPVEWNDINVGFVALALNVIVTAVVSLATRPAAATAPVGNA
jgi:SSS family solute:Na+ symporter